MNVLEIITFIHFRYLSCVSCYVTEKILPDSMHSSVSASVGDEILELNGESLHGLTHDEALHKFKVRQLHCDSSYSICSDCFLGSK